MTRWGRVAEGFGCCRELFCCCKAQSVETGREGLLDVSLIKRVQRRWWIVVSCQSHDR